ncbi:hypothetical protein Tsubulata_011600 [Turnera subulata]|uniref:Protein kinase domain-containing protein n=1 Tax=Turnera subulata TaxID=218843 RepID=A0A9Q0JM55_9ROSI|nr:hypothetical protein Tsubulata_011600 [Turnera subulata]
MGKREITREELDEIIRAGEQKAIADQAAAILQGTAQHEAAKEHSPIIKEGETIKVVKGVLDMAPVVVKQYSRVTASEEDAERNFLREMAYSDYITNLEGYCDEERALILEDGGGNLKAKLGAIDTPSALMTLFIQVTLALQHIHAKGWVYGDLKPENILIDQNKNARICDFNSLAPKGSLIPLSTDAYKSPEVAAGQPAFEAADVHSMGKVMLETMMDQSLESNKELRLSRDYARGRGMRQEPNEGIRAEAIQRGNPLHSRFKNNMIDAVGRKLIELAVNCASYDAGKRPTVEKLLSDLREINISLENKPATNVHKDEWTGGNPNTGAGGSGSSSRTARKK